MTQTREQTPEWAVKCAEAIESDGWDYDGEGAACWTGTRLGMAALIHSHAQAREREILAGLVKIAAEDVDLTDTLMCGAGADVPPQEFAQIGYGIAVMRFQEMLAKLGIELPPVPEVQK